MAGARAAALAREALRLLLAEGVDPGGPRPGALGPWGPAVTLLRRALLARDLAACRALAFELGRSCPHLAPLLPDEARPRRVKSTPAELAAAGLGDCVEWTVPGLLPAGLAVLLGPPGVGKNQLALRLACAVGSGRLLDWVAAEGRVLYLLPLAGLRQLSAPQRRQGLLDADVAFAPEWPPLDRGGMSLLDCDLNLEAYRLVVVDPFTWLLADPCPPDLLTVEIMLAALYPIVRGTASTILAVDDRAGTLARLFDPACERIVDFDAVLRLHCDPGSPAPTLDATAPEIGDLELAAAWPAPPPESRRSCRPCGRCQAC